MSSNLPPGVSVSDIPGNRPEDLARDELAVTITLFAQQYGWMAVQELMETLLEDMIEKCAVCGKLTDEYNETEHRHIHVECLGEWRGTTPVYEPITDLQEALKKALAKP